MVYKTEEWYFKNKYDDDNYATAKIAINGLHVLVQNHPELKDECDVLCHNISDTFGVRWFVDIETGENEAPSYLLAIKYRYMNHNTIEFKEDVAAKISLSHNLEVVYIDETIPNIANVIEEWRHSIANMIYNSDSRVYKANSLSFSQRASIRLRRIIDRMYDN